LKVYAVEPNAAMRAQAPAMAEVQWIDGTFETTPLPDGQVRWVVAAQAFHWADPARALPEMHRILRPGGAFTVLWNDRLVGRSPVLEWTQELIRRYAPAFDEAYRSQAPWGKVLGTTGHFGQVQYLEAEHVVPMSAERFVNLWRSHNSLNVAAGAGGIEPMLGELSRHLDELGLGKVEVPYITRAWTAFRAR
jgi:ubiquinone/menaquinone biosynthesis C-methylase UbiE